MKAISGLTYKYSTLKIKILAKLFLPIQAFRSFFKKKLMSRHTYSLSGINRKIMYSSPQFKSIFRKILFNCQKPYLIVKILNFFIVEILENI